MTTMNFKQVNAADPPSDPFPKIAGFRPLTDVSEHAKIDLDLEEMKPLLDAENFAAAKAIYTDGSNSMRSSGPRTLQGFSTRGPQLFESYPIYQTFKNYWDDPTYADTFVSDALDGTGQFAGFENSPITRIEGAFKGAQYISTFMFVIHEMYDAVADCKVGDLNENDFGVHAWDEAAAFYTGSLEGEIGEGDGYLIHSLAEKRCGAFQTCDESSTEDNIKARSNLKFLSLLSKGQYLLTMKDCDAVESLIDNEIIPQMVVPFVQGVLRYAYRADPAVGFPTTTNGDKEIAEGWVFTAAILPLIHECSPFAASFIRRNMDINESPRVQDGYEAVLDIFMDVYHCLGVTCEDVGEKLAFDDDQNVVLSACRDFPPQQSPIAGYLPHTRVTEHAKIDQDIYDFNNILRKDQPLTQADYDAAKDIYMNGKNSKRSSGMRTLQGFSHQMTTRMPETSPWFPIYRNYWNDDRYADSFVMRAFNGEGEFEGKPDIARVEGAVKGAQYQNVFMFVIFELEDAIVDCQDGDIFNNDDDSVHAWDEGWAFFAGSLEGRKGNSPFGQLHFSLGRKRCSRFMRCNEDGSAGINDVLLGLFAAGRDLIKAGKCDEASRIKDMIVHEMTVSLVQGALQYAYMADPKVGFESSTDGYKERAEGWAFTAAVLPQVHECSSTAAQLIRRNMDLAEQTPVRDGYMAVLNAFHSVYRCMRISCNSVGSYRAPGTTEIVMPACENRIFQEVTIADYQPRTDVRPHSMIDRDVRDFQIALKARDYAKAEQIYTQGAYSKRGSGMRTLQGFSLLAKERMSNWPTFQLYRSYFDDDYEYANTFVMNALKGTGEFAGVSDVIREECAVKGAQYLNVWQYIIHEMYDAIDDCRNKDLNDNEDGVHAWDEAWAFYAGSLQGTKGESMGYLQYAAAEKRCPQFGTCDLDGHTARANSKALAAFASGQVMLKHKDCEFVEELKDEIIVQMTIPLIQGVLRYVYMVDPKSSHESSTNGDKEIAEGWTFAKSVLPQINQCDPQVADLLRENLHFNAEPRMKDGFETVSQRLQSVYSCLNITCEDIGGFLADDGETYLIPPCQDSNLSSSSRSSGLSSGEAAALSIGLLAIGFIVSLYTYRLGVKKSTKNAQPGLADDQNENGNGNKDGETDSMTPV